MRVSLLVLTAVVFVSAFVGRLGAQPLRPDEPDLQAPEYQKIREALRTKRLSLDFTDAPLSDVVLFLRQVLNINIVVDPAIAKEKGPDQLKVSLTVKDVPAHNALDLILGLGGLTRRYANGVLMITTKERHQETVLLATYDVRDLMFTVRDFPGVEIDLTAPSAAGGAGGATFSSPDDNEANELSNPERLVEVVKGNAAGKSWEETAGCSAAIINGLLVVRQTRSGHYEVRRLLLMLRGFR